MRLLLLALVVLPVAAHAQPQPALPDQAVWVRVQSAHFRHTGGVTTVQPSDFDAPLVGLGYARAGLQGEIAFGRGTAPAGPVNILDVDVSLTGDRPLGAEAQAFRFVLPLRLGVSYRRVRPTRARTVNEFAVQTVGVSTGLGAQMALRRVTLGARLLGGVGLATRSFDGTPGLGVSSSVETEARTRLNRRFGLVAGYRLRLRSWDLGRSPLGTNQQADLYDYRAHSHALHVGLLF